MVRASGVALLWRVYTQPRLLAVMILGIISGLPLALTGSTLTTWFADIGVSKGAIGLFASVGLPYALKFIWAPLVDQLYLPKITRLLGRRRSWLLVVQVLLVLVLVVMGIHNPLHDLWITAILALTISFLSATQDIVIDAYRVEILTDDQQAAGAASLVFGYRIGMLISGAGALFLADAFGWLVAYGVMACIIPIGFIVTMLVGEPKSHRPVIDEKRSVSLWMKHAVVNPFVQFMQWRGWWIILSFIVFYKLGDAFAGMMTNPFLIDLAFSKSQIAVIVKTYGVIATLTGAFLGGWLVYRCSLRKSLLICAILQMITNLMFVILASFDYSAIVTIPLKPYLTLEQHSEMFAMLTATITLENLAGGMGTTVFVAFISRLCHREFTATQYALFSALAAVPRTVGATPSGFVVEFLGWSGFFVFSTVLALPGILMILILAKRTDVFSKNIKEKHST